jgi:hypothetical protein
MRVFLHLDPASHLALGVSFLTIGIRCVDAVLLMLVAAANLVVEVWGSRIENHLSMMLKMPYPKKYKSKQKQCCPYALPNVGQVGQELDIAFAA